MIDGILILLLLLFFSANRHLLQPETIENYLHAKKEKSELRLLILLSFGLLFLGAIYSLPATHCSHLGVHYEKLSVNPFAFDSENPAGYRLLTPLISYIFGLHGRLIIVTNLLISVLMIGLVISYFKAVTGKISDGFFAGLVITFSMVILSTFHNGGYCDILTYLLLFLMWRYKEKTILFYLFFLLGLLNRESIAFLIPWFIYLNWESESKKIKAVLQILFGLSVTLILYYLFREWVSTNQTIEFSADYYLQPLIDDPFYVFRQTLPNHGIGLFSVFKLLWIIPILYCYDKYRKKEFKQIFEIFLIIFCCYLQLFIAGDTTRMFTQAFMVMIIALKGLYDSEYIKFKKYQYWLVGFTLLVPQVNTAFQIVEIWNSSILSIFESLVKKG
ncbi:MAG: hypothetical protein DWP97_09075 [Calditrichaeota bacterium]|nr:MAG: hypothetical protein DWP97_09075 [Calditrichota bacterium]